MLEDSIKQIISETSLDANMHTADGISSSICQVNVLTYTYFIFSKLPIKVCFILSLVYSFPTSLLNYLYSRNCFKIRLYAYKYSLLNAVTSSFTPRKYN